MTDDQCAEKLAREYVMQSDWENVKTIILEAWKHNEDMKKADIELAKDLM